MKNRLLSLTFLLATLTALQGCNSDDPVVVAGQVIEQGSGTAITGAIVQITKPDELQKTTTTDSLGNFSFGIDFNETTDIGIEISKRSFESATTNFKLTPDDNVDDLIVELKSKNDTGDNTDNDPGNENDKGGNVGGEPAEPAAIILSGISNQAINIKETGDQVSTAFTFTVQDSAGRPINSNGAVDVNFEIISGPGGEEAIVPKTATTNAQGAVTTSLFSGNVAGPVKIQASLEVGESGVTVKSSPVLVAIHGGFPDDDHFSIAPAKYNFEGYDFNNIRDKITVIVGDKFSNPVKPGTVVYFNTTGGVIQGSGQTDDDGIVEVDLISGDPRPNDNISGSGGRSGYSTVTATTVNENNNRISKDLNVVFSTSNAAISAAPSTFDLDPNGGASFSYTVTDLNGNPMAAGTKIKVEAGEGIEVSGDTDLTLGNHLLPGPGATEFNFSIRDTDDQTDDPASLTIKITVTSPSGNETTYSGISGTRRKTF